MRRGRILLTMVTLAALAAPALEALPTANSKSRVAEWNQRIETAVADLHSENWAQAHTTLSELIGEMIESVDPGKNAAKAFGLVYMLRGVAEAGLGNEVSAAWDWQFAQQLDAGLEQKPPTGFGEASELLERHTLSVDPLPVGLTDAEMERADFTRAEVLSRPSIRYVGNVRMRRWTGTVKIGAYVDAAGALSHPRIEQSAMEVASVVATAESLRGMTFKPAALGGRAVGTRYSLTVSYKLPQ